MNASTFSLPVMAGMIGWEGSHRDPDSTHGERPVSAVMERIDWDRWRARYDAMSFREHQEFNRQVSLQYPEQRCFNADAVRDFLHKTKPERVLELGGWDGGLAAEVLPGFPNISKWVNYDITPLAARVCDDPRYELVVVSDWPWKLPQAGDVLIASHVLEHMLMSEIEHLLSEWDVRAVFMDIPIGSGTPVWHGYEGTHILEVGSTELLFRLGRLGYEVTYCDPAGGLVAHLEKSCA